MSRNYPKYDKYRQSNKPGYWQRFKNFITNAKRVLKVANKPSRKEYFMVFKICSIGMALLGVVSYVIQLIFSVVVPLGN